ncbi:hypothetical protein [Lysinibacillus fusiformis]|uniref:hypothetical protein n=1 Tax=Lysinibacillus fusiformis TaxID=28031 RepID=UPI001E5A8701|nr:hypothetical protein [Lysinibacillus fusiformis]MCE4045800.1 hypothetical protein [Lysinibacillus fusiformis]
MKSLTTLKKMESSHFYTSSLPLDIDPFLSRKPFINTVKQIFNEENLIVIVEGIEFSGKTYFLKEFYETNLSNSIAYFVTQERWLWNLQNILTDLIQQMSEICSPKMRFSLQEINLLDIQLEKIKHIFRELCKDLINTAIQINRPFYFIIDGLDKMDEESRNALLEVIPLGDERGLYLILSRSSDVDFEIESKVKCVPINNFSLPEVKSIMTDLSVSEDDIEMIYEKSNGLAGYIGQVIKDLKRKNYEIEHFINHLPSNIENLLIKNWDGINNEHLKKAIKVIVYSPERLLIENLATILDIEVLNLKEIIMKSDFIKADEDEKLKLENIYLEFLYRHLEDEKKDIEQNLIEYYENKDEESLERIEFLPRLYANKGDRGNYEKIKALVNFDSLNLFFKDSHLSTLMFENIGLLKKMAYSHRDWQKMSSSMVLESMFKQTTATLPSLNKEVDALLALGKYNEALKLISLCSLNEDKLVLLSNTCRVMRENGLEIQPKIIKEIDFYIESCRINKELGIKHAEKFSLIGSNLYSISIDLTIKLIQFCLKDINNVAYKKYITDYMILNIFITLKEKEDVRDTNLHEFVTYLENEELKPIIDTYNHSTLGFSSIYSALEKNTNPYIKIFVLLNWCENNVDDIDFINVTKALLTIFSEEAKAIVKLNDVLRLVKCIQNRDFKDELVELDYIILRLSNLYPLIKPGAYLERIQIELGIIKTKVLNNYEESGFEQFLDLYIKNSEVKDLDLKCLSNCYLLNLICEPEFKKLNDDYHEEIKRLIISDLNKLILSSSNQAGLISEIFYKLALIEPEVALSRAYNVNTEKSRVTAYNKIFNALIETNSFKLVTLKEILRNVKDRVYKDQILINTIKQLVLNNDELLTPEEYKELSNYSKGIESPQGKIIFLVNLAEINVLNPELMEDVYKRIKQSLQMISDNTVKESVAVFIIKKLVKKHPDVAEYIWSSVFSDKVLNYTENRLEVFYKEIIVLMNRSLENVLKIENKSKVQSVPIFISNICTQIESVESKIDRAYLYADLALRGINFNRLDLVQKAIIEYKKIALDDYLDNDSITSILSKTGSLLCIESWIDFEELLNKLQSNSQKNAIITNIIHSMATGRPYHDDVDFGSARLIIETKTIETIIKLLKKIDYDTNLFHCINIVIDAVIASYSETSSKRLNQSVVMVLVDEIKNIIKILPTKEVGIKHDGYIIAIESALLKLKGLNLKSPTLLEKKNLPTYDNLKNRALQIPNISDRAFVLTKISIDMSTHEKEFANKTLEIASTTLDEINNSDDFNTRASLIVSANLKLKNNSAALYTISRAIEKIRLINDEEESEKYIEEFINFCYEIDPTEAKRYVDSIKSRTLNHELNQKFKAKKYHYQPQRILDENISQNEVLENFFKYSLKSIYGNRGTLQTEEVIGEYLYNISTANPELVIQGLTWYVENINLGSNVSISRLDVFFNDLIMSIQLINKLNKYLFDVNQSKMKFDEKMTLTNEYDYYFSVGEHERAYELLIDWINKSVENHLIIYDPYFSVENLELFKRIRSDISTTIFSSSSENDFSKNSQEMYQSYWESICDTAFPDITFMVFVTKNGETPLHDRFLLSEISGLDLGTSINGFHKKDFGIKNIDKQEVENKKRKFVDPLIYNARKEYQGRPIKREVFTL